jgi:hypothetical protein
MDISDILYTPISTSPYPDDFNLNEFRKWAADVYPQWEDKPIRLPQADGTVMDIKKPYYVNNMQEHYGENYAWDVTRGILKGKYLNDFDVKFPSLLNWMCKTFELQPEDLDGLIFISMRPDPIREQWHEDHDAFGYRFYLDLPDGDVNPLVLMPMKQIYKTKAHLRAEIYTLDPTAGDGAYAYKNKNLMNVLTQGRVVKAPYPKNLSAYYLNNFSTLHSVQWNKPDPLRLTGFIEVKENIPGILEKHNDFIKRCAEKYNDYVVRWSND